MTNQNSRFDSSELCPSCFSAVGAVSTCPTCGYQRDSTEDNNCNKLELGAVIRDRYLIGRKLGQGGFGITYLGFDLKLKTKLAIKEYYPSGIAVRSTINRTVMNASRDVAEDFKQGMDKFLEEARTLARFEDYPNIVSIRDYFEYNGTAYMVMEYLEGRTMLKYLKDHGGVISFDETIKILAPIMDVLNEVHASGLIHRDISPDNVFIADSGQVKLLDFGAAKSAMALVNQQSHSILLKKGYSPAEQYQSRGRLGPWTDIYSMGATIYRSIVGSVPPDSIDRMGEDILVPPSKLGIRIPAYAELALIKSLSIFPQDRPQNMEDFKDAIFGGKQNSFVPDSKPKIVVQSGAEQSSRCKKCNAELKNDAKFCLNCGTPISAIQKENHIAIQPSNIETVAKHPMLRGQKENEQLSSSYHVAKKQDKKKIFYAGIVALMLIMALFGYLGIQKNKDLSKVRTAQNTKQENAQIKFENPKTIEEYKKGLKYLENGEYEKAEAWFQKTAKDCDTNDLYLVAKEYNDDKDIREVYSTLYEIPANMGNADATLALAEYYYNSIISGGTTDLAIEWSKKAAAMGKASAYYLLGEIYNGWYGGWPYGQYDNLGIAAKWYKKGSDAGDPDSKEQFEKLISSENTVTGNKDFIKQYDVSIQIGKDGTLLVTEKISFYITHDTINNEIIRSFPLSKRGNEIIPTELRFKVLDIKFDGDDIPWQKNRSAENVKVRIGNSDKNFPLGLHTFTVNYKAEGHIRFLEDHDELYWNVTGTDFKLPIIHASCKVFLPDDYYGEGFKTVEWNVGKYRGDADTSRAEKDDLGNGISTTSPMQFGEEFTVLYTWPKGVTTPKK